MVSLPESEELQGLCGSQLFRSIWTPQTLPERKVLCNVTADRHVFKKLFFTFWLLGFFFFFVQDSATTVQITIFHKSLRAYLIIYPGSLKIICWYALRGRATLVRLHLRSGHRVVICPSSLPLWTLQKQMFRMLFMSKGPSEAVFQHIWGPYIV